VVRSLAARTALTRRARSQTRLLVFGNPRDKFTAGEFDVLKKYIEQGGSVLFMAGETNGNKERDTNINYLLEEFGMSINNDAVVRTVYYKYHHPKEVLVQNSVISKELLSGIGKMSSAGKKEKEAPVDQAGKAADPSQVDFVFPYGSTISVQKPANAILSSGFIAYPLNRAIGAVWEGQGEGRGGTGRVAVLGSVEMFADDWLDKEQNKSIQDALVKWLLRDGDMDLTKVDSDQQELSETHKLPDTEQLSERLRSCLQESEELPKDFMKLFDETLFRFDTNLIPETIALYKQLGVKHEPLHLILPQFEMPLPPLQAAVFPPTIREPPPPALDQFDLDEHFASERLRLAQLTNKCGDDDLEYYIKESGEILGVTGQLKDDQKSAKHVLSFIFQKLVDFKKLNQEKDDEGESDANYRPSTAAAINAVFDQGVMPDYRPDTASAIKAVSGRDYGEAKSTADYR
jgi:intraflagellar transport protein 52